MLIACAAAAAAALADPIALETTRVRLNAEDRAQDSVGRLRFLGGLELRSADPRFGGLSGLALGAAGRRLVLTGGASQLHGVPDMAARILDKQVRVGRPIKVSGLAESTGGPAFAACAGLLSHALHGTPEALTAGAWDEETMAGPLVRVGRWVHAYL